MSQLLEIRNLAVRFSTASGSFTAVEGVDITVDRGEILAIVGESGSGKSVSMMALMDLLPWTATVTADVMTFEGRDLRGLSARQRRGIYGKDLAMIFQEPMSSLNPCFTVGAQIDEVLRRHLGGSGSSRRERGVQLLSQVGIPDPEGRYNSYPHQMSGGMSQRVMIAMALACDPKLLIADEPTTALDVTIQAQILDLLKEIQAERQMGLILITHDMAVVAETAHRVAVHYAGWRVEMQPVKSLFRTPCHPYTAALLSALPENAQKNSRLPTIPGVVPGQHNRPDGCLFEPRCGHAQANCKTIIPLADPDDPAQVRCLHPLETAAERAAFKEQQTVAERAAS
ncbi:MAG: ABC transporter ATP-binding protein [Pseudomonadota bacterium]